MSTSRAASPVEGILRVDGDETNVESLRSLFVECGYGYDYGKSVLRLHIPLLS